MCLTNKVLDYALESTADRVLLLDFPRFSRAGREDRPAAGVTL